GVVEACRYVDLPALRREVRVGRRVDQPVVERLAAPAFGYREAGRRVFLNINIRTTQRVVEQRIDCTERLVLSARRVPLRHSPVWYPVCGERRDDYSERCHLSVVR